uniref:Uncharacterized protein n=1 Tax=Acrobeloides nanus TaxID=290746 RepID=A0A914CSM1_9BILA
MALYSFICLTGITIVMATSSRERLPQTSQKQAREIIFSKTMGYDKKNNALEKFVAALPADQAKLMSEESKFGGGCILWRVYCWWD